MEIETTKNNELIAKFRGYKLCDIGDGNSPYYNHNDKYIKPSAVIRLDKGEVLQFDSSWEWLMPVVEQIQRITYVSVYTTKTAYGEFSIEISHETSGYPFSKNNKRIFIKDSSLTQRESVYKAVVEFIEWYIIKFPLS